MARYTFMPTRDADLRAFTGLLSATVGADPQAYVCEALMLEAYAIDVAAFAQAIEIVADPRTRTPGAFVTKRDLRAILIASTRVIVAIIHANPRVTDEMRVNLSLTVRAPKRRRRSAPTTRASITQISMQPYAVAFAVRQEGAIGRARDPEAIGVYIRSFAGETPPGNLDQWTGHGLSVSSNVRLQFPSTLAPGTTIWLVAAWVGHHGESGPIGQMISVNLQGGVAMERGGIRAAA